MSNQTEQDKILNKIKKCLRMAGSSNANEAATAMRQAQALMAQHSVTLTDVQAAEANSYKAKANVIAKPSTWESILAGASAQAFGCKLIFISNAWMSEPADWKFIGVGVAPELAGYAFGVLLRQVKRDRTEYIKTALKRCKTSTKTKRADIYCKSWVVAAQSKIAAIAPSQEAATAIDAYMNKHHGNRTDLKSRERKWRVNDSDYTAGHLAGKNANLNRGVNGSAPTNRLEHE